MGLRKSRSPDHPLPFSHGEEESRTPAVLVSICRITHAAIIVHPSDHHGPVIVDASTIHVRRKVCHLAWKDLTGLGLIVPLTDCHAVYAHIRDSRPDRLEYRYRRCGVFTHLMLTVYLIIERIEQPVCGHRAAFEQWHVRRQLVQLPNSAGGGIRPFRGMRGYVPRKYF